MRRCAFIFEQKNKYYLLYSDYFGHKGDGYLLCYRSIGSDGLNSRRVTSIDCFCSIEAARNTSIVCWGAGLGSLESLNLIRHLVRETKKKEARNQRPITPSSNDDEEISPTQNVRLRYILHGLSGELEIDVMRMKNIRYDDLVSNLAHDHPMQYKTPRISYSVTTRVTEPMKMTT